MTLLSSTLIILLAAFVVLATGAPLSDSERESILKEKFKIAAFYNMYASGPDFKAIVQDQVRTIKGGGLLDRLDKVFYATMGKGGDEFSIDDPKYVHIAHYGDVGEEIQTLSLLYEFCHENPTSKVLYFHDKGSYHHSYANVKMCSLLNCYVLNPNCIEALDSHDTCGFRISPQPFIHYSGNFWWARCSYINTLVDPMSPQTNQTFIDAIASLNDCVGMQGRYFAETWIGTAPVIRPADCLDVSVDTSYVWGYKFPWTADANCHGADIPSGSECKTASTFTDVIKFKHAINTMTGLMPEKCRDNRAEVVKRTELIYGTKPLTYIEWMNRLYDVQDLNENQLVRFTDSTQVYVYQSGELRGIPNINTFIKMGFDFDNVKVVYASDKDGYQIGSMLPTL